LTLADIAVTVLRLVMLERRVIWRSTNVNHCHAITMQHVSTESRSVGYTLLPRVEKIVGQAHCFRMALLLHPHLNCNNNA